MLNWCSLADRLMVGVPVMIAVVGAMLMIARAEEHTRKTRARRRRGR